MDCWTCSKQQRLALGIHTRPLPEHLSHSPRRHFSRVKPGTRKSNAHLNSGTARLVLDAGRLELCGRDGGLEFSSLEDCLRSGIDEINIQSVASVLVHAPEP